VIIIFGCGVRPDGSPSATLRRRVEAAFRFGGVTADYMPTGGIGRHPPSEASVMAGLLQDFGVPPGQITLEQTATNTMASARACAILLQGRPGPVFAASSGYHLPRCVMLLRLAGVAARGCPSPPPDAHWAARWYWRLRECAALPVDAVLMTVRRT
jgi:uncharacterized SAM-binding protein YcdF (DUF218 family)